MLPYCYTAFLFQKAVKLILPIDALLLCEKGLQHFSMLSKSLPVSCTGFMIKKI